MELVSVVIPNRDREALVVETLASLRAQTYPRWEAHVVDDSSKDGSVAAVKAMAREDRRIHSHQRTGQPGGNACRNEGLARSVGDWVLFLDSDDLLSPGCLAGRLRHLAEARNLDFGVFPHDHFLLKPGDLDQPFQIPVSQDYLTRFIAFQIPWQTSGPLWRRASLDRVGGWDEGLAAGQDLDFHARALAAGLRFEIFPEPRFFHRVSTRPGSRITNEPRSPGMLASRERLAERLWRLINDRDLWTETRRRLLARLHLVNAEDWLSVGEPARAREVWRRAADRRLVGSRLALEGRVLLSLWPISPLRRAFRVWQRLTWPAELRYRLPPHLVALASVWWTPVVGV